MSHPDSAIVNDLIHQAFVFSEELMGIYGSLAISRIIGLEWYSRLVTEWEAARKIDFLKTHV